MFSLHYCFVYVTYGQGGSVAEWLSCWTQAQKGGFTSQLRHYWVTVLGKLLTTIVPLFTKQQKLVAALLMVVGGNCRPGGKQWQPTARFMTYVTCRLTTKNW